MPRYGSRLTSQTNALAILARPRSHILVARQNGRAHIPTQPDYEAAGRSEPLSSRLLFQFLYQIVPTRISFPSEHNVHPDAQRFPPRVTKPANHRTAFPGR